MSIVINNPNHTRNCKFVRDLAMANTNEVYVIGGGCPTDLRFGRPFKDIDVWVNDNGPDFDYQKFIVDAIQATGAVVQSITVDPPMHYGDSASIRLLAVTCTRNDIQYVVELMRIRQLGELNNLRMVKYLIEYHFGSNVTTNFICRCEGTNRCMFVGSKYLYTMAFGDILSQYALKTINKYLPYYSCGWSDRVLTYRSSRQGINYGITPFTVQSLVKLTNRRGINEYLYEHREKIREARNNTRDQGIPVATPTADVSSVWSTYPPPISGTGSLPPRWVHTSSSAQELQPNRGEARFGGASVSSLSSSIDELVTALRESRARAASIQAAREVAPPSPQNTRDEVNF
jgi:hypothetical protein